MDSDYIYCRYQECTVGNLICDSVKEISNGEIAIINAGTVKSDILKGNLTRVQIIEIIPWFDNIVIKELDEQVILNALEFRVSKYPSLPIFSLKY